MKLLFDQNLAPSLVKKLDDIFPGSDHVFLLGLDRADDRTIRGSAAANGFTIVTKDADYAELNTIFGPPPKVVWIRRGNCTVAEIEALIRGKANEISGLENDISATVLTIY